MAKSRRKPSKRKIKFTQRTQIVAKRDKTRVNTEKGDTVGLKRMQAQMPRDNGLNMRIKIRRKTK